MITFHAKTKNTMGTQRGFPSSAFLTLNVSFQVSASLELPCLWNEWPDFHSFPCSRFVTRVCLCTFYGFPYGPHVSVCVSACKGPVIWICLPPCTCDYMFCISWQSWELEVMESCFSLPIGFWKKAGVPSQFQHSEFPNFIAPTPTLQLFHAALPLRVSLPA